MTCRRVDPVAGLLEAEARELLAEERLGELDLRGHQAEIEALRAYQRRRHEAGRTGHPMDLAQLEADRYLEGGGDPEVARRILEEAARSEASGGMR